MKIKLIILSLLFSSSAFSTGIFLTCQDNTLGKGPFVNKSYVMKFKDDPRCGLEKPTDYAYIKFDTELETGVIEYFSCDVKSISSFDASFNMTVKKLLDEYIFFHPSPLSGTKMQHTVSRKDLTITGIRTNGVCEMEEISKEENIF